MNLAEEENLINSFLKNRKLILFQSTPTIEFHIDKLFSQMAFEPIILKIQQVSDLENLLHTDGDVCLLANTSTEGLESIIKHCGKESFSRKTTVIIYSEDLDELSVLNFARNKIDGHLTSPVSSEKLRYHLVKSIEASALRKNYVKIEESAGKLVSQGRTADAKDYLETQLRMSKRPEIGHCILGEIFKEHKNYELALQNFIRALSYKPKNYRALKGLYDLFSATDHSQEAYASLKKLFTLYPADPDDLCHAIRLCIQTNHLNDLEKLMALYFKLRGSSEKLDRYACAGLAVYCQFLVTKNKFKAARAEIEKLKKFRFPRGPFLNPLILMLRDRKKADDVAFLLKLFRKEDHRYKDYKIATYYHYCVSESEQETSRFALQIISEGVHTPQLFEETIKRLTRLGDKEQAEKLKTKARELWPSLIL